MNHSDQFVALQNKLMSDFDLDFIMISTVYCYYFVVVFLYSVCMLLQLCELWCLNLVFLVLFQHMVMSFRVSELQVLLGYAGRNKSGRKQELLQRALLLVQKGCSTPVQIKIRELYRYILYLDTFSSFELLQSKCTSKITNTTNQTELSKP